MLSAHQPFERYPEVIRAAARVAGATAQVAGGVPAMCDGVTQGRAGMELSLFSRDVIALATAVALSHEAFDAALLLGICDKIVPGLFIGARVVRPAAHHLRAGRARCPPAFANKQKAEVRQRYAEGLATRDELLAAEMSSYHDAGTCTFYGTANSNQMLMEMMGLHVPGAAFVNSEHAAAPRAHGRRHAARRADHGARRGLSAVRRSDRRALVRQRHRGADGHGRFHQPRDPPGRDGARRAASTITWDDMADISRVTPLLARVYPNGEADVNQFHAAGGMALRGARAHRRGPGARGRDDRLGAGPAALRAGAVPRRRQARVARRAPRSRTTRRSCAPSSNPFSADGGLKLLRGNLGRSVIKTSAVRSEVLGHHRAGARVREPGSAGRGAQGRHRRRLHRRGARPGSARQRHARAAQADPGVVGAVWPGAAAWPSSPTAACPALRARCPSAIHLTPEAAADGPISRLRDGDIIRLDARAGVLEAQVDAATLAAREPVKPEVLDTTYGVGRELFTRLREGATPGGRRRVDPVGAG